MCSADYQVTYDYDYDNKINAITAIHSITRLELKEAKKQLNIISQQLI